MDPNLAAQHLLLSNSLADGSAHRGLPTRPMSHAETQAAVTFYAIVVIALVMMCIVDHQRRARR